MKYPYFILPLLVVAGLALFPKWTVDDAFITFRYADNLAKHGELTWNVGEEPVEGYTGVLLPVTLAGSIKLGISPNVASKCTGVASFLLSGVLLFLILLKFGVREPVRAVAVSLFCTAPLMFRHAFSGLETCLFIAASLASFYALVLCLDSGVESAIRRRRENLFFVALLIAALIRPDGVALAMTYIPALAIGRWLEDRRGIRGFAFRFVLIYFLPGLIYFLWRFNYYGRLMPNTYYAKYYPGLINWASVASLIEFLHTYLAVPAAIAIVLLAGGFFARGCSEESKGGLIAPRGALLWGANAAFIMLMVLQYARSRLIMNYAFRFYAPLLPYLLIGVAVAANQALQRFQTMRVLRPRVYRMLVSLVAALGMAQAAVYGFAFREEVLKSEEYIEAMKDEHERIGEFLRENIPRNEWLIVYIDGGIIPYLSGLKTVDFGKLSDKYLARRDVTEPEMIEYFFGTNAGAVVFTSRNWNSLKFPLDDHAAKIEADPRFQRYVLFKKYRTDQKRFPSTYYQFLYLRKDLAEKLAKATG